MRKDGSEFPVEISLSSIPNGLQLMKLAGEQVAIIEQARSMMERQVTQMVRLVDDLMDVGRISRGKLGNCSIIWPGCSLLGEVIWRSL
ncbi:MAG: hypothetical protein WD049_07680 [Candidatus Paceibacterota bacterium]